MVSGCRPPRRAGRLLAGQGVHGHPPVRLRHLGTAAAGARRADQGNRARQRLLPALHPREPAEQGGRARRGLLPAGRLCHARRRRGARGEARRPADVGSHHRDDVREVGAGMARPADPDQPVGERRALGEGDAAVSADHRVPLAGRAHRARNGRGGRGRDAQDPRPLRRRVRVDARHAGREGPEVGEREVCRRPAHLFDRGADGRRARAAGGHVAQPRTEFREGVRHHLPGARQVGAARVGHVVGRDDAAGRRA